MVFSISFITLGDGFRGLRDVLLRGEAGEVLMIRAVRKMNRVLVIALFVAVVISPLKGQVNRYGVPLYESYNLTEFGVDVEYSHTMTVDSNGILYLGTDGQGVLRYDGSRWDSIHVRRHVTIYSMVSSPDNTIFLGGADEFGFIEPDHLGRSQYRSLTQRAGVDSVGIVWSAALDNERVVYVSDRRVFIYYPAGDTLKVINAYEQGGYRLLFRVAAVGGRLFISDNIRGLTELLGYDLLPVAGGESYSLQACTFMLPWDDNTILIGSRPGGDEPGGISLFNIETGVKSRLLRDESLNRQLSDETIYAGAILSDGRFAVGTLYGEGVRVFGSNGELLYRLDDNNSGLSSTMITGLYSNPNRPSPLWILSPQMLTKSYIHKPLASLADESGPLLMQDLNNDITELAGSLLLATDSGVERVIYDKGGWHRLEIIEAITGQVTSLTPFNYGGRRKLIVTSQDGTYLVTEERPVVKIEENLISDKDINSYQAWSATPSERDGNVIYLGRSRSVTGIAYLGNGRWEQVFDHQLFPDRVSQITICDEGYMWVATVLGKTVYRVDSYHGEGGPGIKEYNIESGVPEVSNMKINLYDSTLFLITREGVFTYSRARDVFLPDTSLFKDILNTRPGLLDAFRDMEGYTWVAYESDEHSINMGLIDPEGRYFDRQSGLFRMLPGSRVHSLYSDSLNNAWIPQGRRVFIANREGWIASGRASYEAFFNMIVAGDDSLIMRGSFVSEDPFGRLTPVLHQPEGERVVLPYSHNRLRFEWTCNHFTDEGSTLFSYMLEGDDDEWSPWSDVRFGYYNRLRFGDYAMKVRALTKTGHLTGESHFYFTILRPWYATAVAIFIYAVLGVALIILIIYLYTRRLRLENIRLEGIVAERTAVVVRQKEELEASIHYASRIQRALLPSEKLLSESVSSYFIFFKPRDIVSGDFYWMAKRRGEKLFIVAADCTGHGVPGAFMSLLGISFLEEIVNKSGTERADKILNELRLYVTTALKQVGDDDEAKDGMDLALMVIDFETDTIQYSGAYNPCYRVRPLTSDEKELYKEGSLEVLQGQMCNGTHLLQTVNASKMPIGISGKMGEEFDLHEWKIVEGESCYIFSDGYVDQFGVNVRKFMKKNFKKLLLAMQSEPLESQGEIVERTLTEWMGDTEQIDDIIVMGFRVR